ncbi:hypothetical protein PgNI_06411, partial [Pyricularia grisea]|uniref:Uncharacterized protein n=1 Tax=Pyricularia grisea TaxID=148305 RepID=A0A6P8B565_PYRGI
MEVSHQKKQKEAMAISDLYNWSQDFRVLHCTLHLLPYY